MRTVLSALVLSAALAGTAAAQEARLTGTVTDVFDRQIVLATPEGRVLVALPEGAAAPAPGTRVAVTGMRRSASFDATGVQTLAGPGTGPAAAVVPADLAALGLSDVIRREERSRHGDVETKVHGRLPGGGWLRAELRDGRIVEAKVSEGALPEALIAALLAPAVRNAPQLAEFARIAEIDHKRDGTIEVEGYGCDGTRLEAEFWPSGQLRKFEREHDDRRSMSEPAARERLAALGYREVGFVNRGGRHVDAVARNPWGDWVEVRIKERGEIDRERLWTR